MMKNSKRNGNVEVLRCLLMFLIVFHHVGYNGYFAHPTDWWSLLIWSFVMWHVDGFVAISGWYGIRLTARKFFSLYGVMLFYSAIGCFLWWVLDPATFRFRAFYVSGGWFGSAYLMLMLMSPFVNAAIDYLSKDKLSLIGAWFLFAVGMTLSWIPGHLNTAVASGSGSWSLLCLLFVYVSSRSARCVFEKPIPMRYLLWGLSVLPIGICICGGINIIAKVIKGSTATWSMLNWLSVYDAPHVWLFALFVLMLFVWHVNFPDWVKRFCTAIGPSMFGIYLMHEVMHNGRLIYRIPQGWLYSRGLSPLGCVILTAISTFLICLAVDTIRRLLVKPLSVNLMSIMDKIQIFALKWVCKKMGRISCASGG